MNKAITEFTRLLNIMDQLRENCPWDKKQTIESIRHLTIEEVYELSDAIINNDINEIKKELGDLMLHIVFYSRIASETGAFNISNVLESISEKLILRHPHIFSDTKVNNAEDVKQNWEKIKLNEGKKSTLSGVPDIMPSIIKAHRIQEKAHSVGFDWENPEQVLDKVAEELNELRVELKKPSNLEKIQDEFGDLLFSLINFARFVKVNPDDALEKTNKKFIRRFKYIEEQAKLNGKEVHNLSLDEMEALWNKAKTNE